VIPANLKGLIEEEKPVVPPRKRPSRAGANKATVSTDEV